jgi:hypothetical protein
VGVPLIAVLSSQYATCWIPAGFGVPVASLVKTYTDPESVAPPRGTGELLVADALTRRV